MPESIAISFAATPHRITNVIVQDDHHACVHKGFDRGIKHFHRLLSLKARICSENVVSNHWIEEELLEREHEADAVEAFIGDSLRDFIDVDKVQAVDSIALHMCSIPIHAP